MHSYMNTNIHMYVHLHLHMHIFPILPVLHVTREVHVIDISAENEALNMSSCMRHSTDQNGAWVHGTKATGLRWRECTLTAVGQRGFGLCVVSPLITIFDLGVSTCFDVICGRCRRVQASKGCCPSSAILRHVECTVATCCRLCSCLGCDVLWVRIVYSDLVGYQTSDIRLLWTITPNPPTPPQHPFYPPPPPCQTSPPPRVPPSIRLVPLSPHP